MYLNEKTREINNNFFEGTFQMSYEEFEQLDFEEQQEFIKRIKRQQSKSSDDSMVTVMIGQGRDSTFIKRPRGEKAMIGTGRDSSLVRIRLSLEEEKKKLNQELERISSPRKNKTKVLKLPKK